jgi:two-component system, response regulator YesN
MNSYKDAEHILKLCHFWNKNRIVSTEDIKKSSDGLLSLQENDPLVDRLKYAGNGEIDNIISQYLELLQDNSDHFPIIASYLLVDVIMAVSKLIEDLGGNIKEVMPEILTHKFVDNAVQNQETFITEIRRVLSSILKYRNSKMQGRYGDVILKAKNYIEKNYANQDTCLHSVADEVHLSPNHFSTIFSQECGITFIEYLTTVRVEQAKKLLRNTDMKGSDIAYDVGFSDPHYFSFIFKKTTGFSPREYRNNETN